MFILGSTPKSDQNRVAPSNRIPLHQMDRMGPRNRVGPPTRTTLQNRMGPPNRVGPPNRMAIQNRMGPPGRLDPPNRIDSSQHRNFSPNRMGPPPNQRAATRPMSSPHREPVPKDSGLAPTRMGQARGRDFRNISSDRVTPSNRTDPINRRNQPSHPVDFRTNQSNVRLDQMNVRVAPNGTNPAAVGPPGRISGPNQMPAPNRMSGPNRMGGPNQTRDRMAPNRVPPRMDPRMEPSLNNDPSIRMGPPSTNHAANAINPNTHPSQTEPLNRMHSLPPLPTYDASNPIVSSNRMVHPNRMTPPDRMTPPNRTNPNQTAPNRMPPPHPMGPHNQTAPSNRMPLPNRMAPPHQMAPPPNQMTVFNQMHNRNRPQNPSRPTISQNELSANRMSMNQLNLNRNALIPGNEIAPPSQQMRTKMDGTMAQAQSFHQNPAYAPRRATSQDWTTSVNTLRNVPAPNRHIFHPGPDTNMIQQSNQMLPNLSAPAVPQQPVGAVSTQPSQPNPEPIRKANLQFIPEVLYSSIVSSILLF